MAHETLALSVYLAHTSMWYTAEWCLTNVWYTTIPELKNLQSTKDQCQASDSFVVIKTREL